MNDSWSWAYGFKCYEMLRAVDDMRTLGRELKALYAMKSSRLWLVRTSPSLELKALDTMNNSRLWVYDSGYYEELRVLEDMNKSGSCELKPLYVMKNLGL